MDNPAITQSRKPQPANYGGGSRRPDGTYAAPRRYSIALMMIVTTAFAALLTAVRVWFDMPPAGIVATFLFFVVVGVGQSVLFRGKKPRMASMICGAVALPMLMLLFIWLIPPNDGGPPFAVFFCQLVFTVLMGAPAGYLAGGLIGGVFLICDNFAALLLPGQANPLERDATFDEIVGHAPSKAAVEAEIVEAEVIEVIDAEVVE